MKAIRLMYKQQHTPTKLGQFKKRIFLNRHKGNTTVIAMAGVQVLLSKYHCSYRLLGSSSNNFST